MNIAICYPTPFNVQIGGVERVSDILAREFTRRGHRIFFLHNYRKELVPEYDYPVEVLFFPQKDYRSEENLRWFHDFLISNSIDIVINQCGQFGDSILYCNTNGTAKTVSVIHASPELNLKCLFSEISRLKTGRGKSEHVKRLVRCILYPYIYRKTKKGLSKHYKWLSRHTDKIVLLSKSFFPSFYDLYGGKISLSAISNPSPFDVERANEKEKIVLWVGRMDTQKRPDLMVRIWERLKLDGWKLVMIGDGPLLKRTKKMAKGIESIHFTGFIDPLPYYRRASILCMTSGHEGFPMVLLETISLGCVPIAFHSFDSITDIIRDPRQLIKPVRVDDYVMKLRELMVNKPLQSELREKGYEIAKEYGKREITNQWDSLFNIIYSSNNFYFPFERFFHK